MLRPFSIKKEAIHETTQLAGSGTAATLAPRLPILGAELSESFFANGAVLVEEATGPRFKPVRGCLALTSMQRASPFYQRS